MTERIRETNQSLSISHEFQYRSSSCHAHRQSQHHSATTPYVSPGPFPTLAPMPARMITRFRPPFSPSAACRFNLRLYPNGFAEADKGVIIFLHLADATDHKEVGIVYRFAVLDSYGVKYCVKELRGKFIRECQFGFPEYIRRSYLLDPANRLLREDRLTIDCEIELYIDPAFSLSQFATLSSSSPHHSKIQLDFDHLLTAGRLRDVTLCFSGDSTSGITRELLAHKDILAARSTVFRAMFARETNLEVRENRVTITDVDYEVFQELLRFLYTGRVAGLEEWADRLLAAADKYDLPDLKAQCEEYLCTQMSSESASSLLLLADMYSCSRLKTVALGFFHNNAAKIMKTKACEQLSQLRPDIFKELYFHLATAKKPDEA